MRLAKLIVCACLLLAMPFLVGQASAAFARQFSEAGSDGLRLLHFAVQSPHPSRLGDVATIEFTLKNESNRTLTFDRKFGIFVGVRWKMGTHKKLNRDFGHSHQGYRLKPGQAITIRFDKILDMPGTWVFWPAYRLNGHWGSLDSFKKRLLVGQ